MCLSYAAYASVADISDLAIVIIGLAFLHSCFELRMLQKFSKVCKK